MPSSPLSQTVEDLQLQLRLCGSMKERATIRSAIQQLREKQDPFIRGTSIRRSRKKTAQKAPVEYGNKNSKSIEQTVADLQPSTAKEETKSTDFIAVRSSLRRSRRRLARLPPDDDKTKLNETLVGDNNESKQQCPTMEQHPKSQDETQDVPGLGLFSQTSSVRRSRRKLPRLPKDDPSETEVVVECARESDEKKSNNASNEEEVEDQEDSNETEENETMPVKSSEIFQDWKKDIEQSLVAFVEDETSLDQPDEPVQENVIFTASASPATNDPQAHELLSEIIETPSCGFRFDVTKDLLCDVTKGSEHPRAPADGDSAPGLGCTPVGSGNKQIYPKEFCSPTTAPESSTAGEFITSVLSPKLAPESSGRRSRSRSPFSRFLKTKSSENFPVKKQEPKSPPPSESKDSGFGKRRFSKRFRKRTSKSNSSGEVKEIAKTADEGGDTPQLPSQPPIAVSSRSSGVISDDLSSRPDLHSDPPSSSDPHSAKATSSVRDHSRKQSARVVLRAIGKKLFTPKQKLHNDLEPPVKKPNSPPSTPFRHEPKSPTNLFKVEHEIKLPSRFATPLTTHLASLSSPIPSQSEKQASPVWKKRKSTSGEMEVLARPQDGAPNQLQSSFSSNNQERDDVTVRSSVDYEAMSISELKFLLSTSSTLQEKEKIRSVIRSLLEDSDEDTAASFVNSPSNGPSSSLKRSTPVQRTASPSLDQAKSSFNVSFNNNKATTKPWDPSPTRKHSFRPVATPTARTTSKEDHSSPPDNARHSQEETTPKVGRSSNSRFGKREFSASVRTFRPSFQAPGPSINRTESLKLHRPKDFIKADSSTSSSGASPVAKPRTVLESSKSSSNVESASSPKVSKVKAAFNYSLKQSQHPISSVTLQRSESSKENDVAFPEKSPFIPVVRGNKRRSRGILGRVLGFKIDSETHSSPKQHTTPPKTFNSESKSTPALPETVLDSVSEEKSSPPVLENSSHLKRAQLSIQPDTLPEDFSIENSNKKESDTDLSEVVCETEAEKSRSFIEETQHLSEDKCVVLTADQSISDLIRELVDKTVELISLPELPSEHLRLTQDDPEEKALFFSDVCENGKSEDKPALFYHPEEAQVIATDEVVQTKDFAAIVQESTLNDDNQLLRSCSVEVCFREESITSFDPKDSCEVKEDPVRKILQDIVEKVAGSSNPSNENREAASSLDSSLTETTSDSSGNEIDFEDEDAMEGRYSVRNRYGSNAGSVKSRILAKEDSSRSSAATDVVQLKKSRQAADLRAFRNLEGVKSRMNKFSASSNVSPIANGSSRFERKTEPKNNRVNENSKTNERSERLKKYEKTTDDVNNNNISKSSLITRSKYSSDVKSRTIVSNGEVTKRIDRETKIQKDVNENETKSSVVVTTAIETTTVDSSFDVVDSPQAIEEQPDNDTQVQQSEEKEEEISSQGDAKETEQIETSSDDHTNEDNDVEAVKRDLELTEPATAKEEIEDDITRAPSSYVNGDVRSSSETDSNELISASPSSSRAKPVDSDQSCAQPSEDAPEKGTASEPERVVRSRRQRRSERSSASETTETDSTDIAKEMTYEQPRKDDLQLTKLETSAEPPVPARRRRRVKNSKNLSKSSTSSSTASTPDQEEKVSVADTPESRKSSSASTPESAESPVFTDSVTDTANVCEPEAKATLASAEETSHVTNGDTPEEKEDGKDDVTTITAAPKGASHIKLKRIWSAPDDGQLFSSDIDEATDNVVKEQVDSPVISTENRSEDAGKSTETTEAPVVEEPVVEEPAVEEPAVEEPVVEEPVVEEPVVEEPAVEEPVVEEPVVEKPAEIRYTLNNFEECPDESILQGLLDKADMYDDRKRIRAAIRALKKARADGGGSATTRLSSQRQARATTTIKTADKSTTRTMTTKTEYKETKTTSSKWQPRTSSPLVGAKAPTDPKSLAEKYAPTSTTKKDMTSSSKKVGSIFDREEEAPKKSSSRLDVERRQAERKRDALSRNRSMPASSIKDARKMFVAKLEGESGGGAKSGKKVGRSPTFVVPNANNVKQMLLKWCQSKTRGYEHVDINNYSSSWANGMAFCALVHNFFPDAFDYSKLDPKNRAHNFDLAFTTAEKHANADPLLEVEDMIFMGNRPDSKCVFTYVQSLYNKLRRFETPLQPLAPLSKEKSGNIEKKASDSA